MKYRLAQQPLSVELNDTEVQETLDFVEAMRVDKVDHKVKDMMFDQKNTSEGINIIGHLGEQAVGKVLDIPVDTEVRTHGDAGWDLEYKGLKIQVKTSTLPKLIFNAPRLFSADIAILAQYVGEDRKNAQATPMFRIWGWTTKKEFLEKYYNENYGYGDRFVLDAHELHALDCLEDEVDA